MYILPIYTHSVCLFLTFKNVIMELVPIVENTEQCNEKIQHLSIIW